MENPKDEITYLWLERSSSLESNVGVYLGLSVLLLISKSRTNEW